MSTAVRIPNHIRASIDPDGAVLFDLKAGKYFSLNRIGAEMWRCLEAGLDIADVHAQLKRVCDVDDERLRRDIADFIDQLDKMRIIDVHQ